MKVLIDNEIFEGIDFDRIDKKAAFNLVLNRFGRDAINPYVVYLAGCYLLDNDFEILNIDTDDIEDMIELKVFEYLLKDGDVLEYDPFDRARKFFSA